MSKLAVFASFILFAGCTAAPSFKGTWQTSGVWKAGVAPAELRVHRDIPFTLTIHITSTKGDANSQAISGDAILHLEDASLRTRDYGFNLDGIASPSDRHFLFSLISQVSAGRFPVDFNVQGQISEDGNSLTGMWQEGGLLQQGVSVKIYNPALVLSKQK